MDWKDFFDRLGMNGTRWQWRIMKWERSWRALLGGHIAETGFTAARLIIGINVFLFVLMIIKGVFAGQGFAPVLNPGGYIMIHMGAQYWPLVLVEQEWWRCITYAYTHGGLIHIGFNMMVLYQVGPFVEREIGTIRFIVLYTLTALTATIAGFAWQLGYLQQWVTVVGASGSLFGLIGFMVTYCHRVGGPVAHDLRNQMFRWAVIAFVFGLIIGADNAGHFGGAVGGALFGLILPIGVRGQQTWKGFFNWLGIGCLLATVGSLGMLVLSWVFR